jgi:hypothetical protein
MKNKFGLILLLLIMAGGMIMMTTGCSNSTGGDETPTKFEGEWKLESDGSYRIYSFSGNRITSRDSRDESYTWSGTFTFTDTTITFTPTSHEDVPQWTQGYQFLENPTRLKLLPADGEDFPSGELIKQ